MPTMDRFVQRIALLGFALVLAWLTACARSPKSSGDGLEKEVQNALAVLPYYRAFDNVTFAINGGAATLSGQVTTAALKKDAEKAVKSIGGVERVENKIEVLPPSRRDDQIRLEIYAATYGQRELRNYAGEAVAPVHIIVKNANVTLVGTVNSAKDKTLFVETAAGVAGVTSVTDHLQLPWQVTLSTTN